MDGLGIWLVIAFLTGGGLCHLAINMKYSFRRGWQIAAGVGLTLALGALIIGALRCGLGGL